MAKIENKKIDFSSGMAALTSAKLANASIDYGNAALTPLIDYFTNRMALAEETAASFLASIPDDFSMEKVPDEVKPMLTDWMMGQKQKMRALSKQLGKLSYKKTSPEYIALEKEFNILKNSFTLANSGLDSLAKYRSRGINTVKQGIAHGQDPADVNALLEFIGKEGYKRLQFRNDGVYYKDLKGQEYNVADLINIKGRNSELHGALLKLNSSASKLGLQGLDLKIDENGNAIGANALEIQNGVAALLQDEDFAKDLFLGGLVGDYSGNSKIVDYYIAEQISLGMPGYEGIEVKDGKAVASGDSYSLKILELAQKTPINYIQQFILKSMIDQSNSEGYNTYLASKNTDEKDEFIDPKAFADSIRYGRVTPARLITNRPDAQYQYIFLNEKDGKTGKAGTYYIGRQNGEPSANPAFHNLTPIDLARLYGFDASILDIEGSTEPAFDPNLKI